MEVGDSGHPVLTGNPLPVARSTVADGTVNTKALFAALDERVRTDREVRGATRERRADSWRYRSGWKTTAC